MLEVDPLSRLGDKCLCLMELILLVVQRVKMRGARANTRRDSRSSVLKFVTCNSRCWQSSVNCANVVRFDYSWRVDDAELRVTLPKPSRVFQVMNMFN